MRPKKITSSNGEKLRVSINRRLKIANFTTYKDGKPCAKYWCALDDDDMRYYDDGCPSFSDWNCLLHDNCVLKH